MFEITTPTAATLTSVTPRTEKHGDDDVFAVSLGLQIIGPNTLLDLLDPTLRATLYTAPEGQEQLPGIDPSTPLLRTRAIDHLKLSASFDGWTLAIDHGIDEADPIKLSGAKVDKFVVEPMQGGSVEIRFRVGSSDIDAAEAGQICAHLGQEISITLRAPEKAPDAIDGSVEAFKKDHPDAREPDATDLFAAGGESGDETDETGVNADESAGAEDTDAEREQRELEAGMAASIADAGVKPARRGRVAH
jgi:hypothetical protein